MVKLIVLNFYIVPFILRLGLFLKFFGDLEPRCSYKIVLIKKECMTHTHTHTHTHTLTYAHIAKWISICDKPIDINQSVDKVTKDARC